MAVTVQVLMLKTNKSLTYRTEDESVACGSRVWVPYRNTIKLGLVIEVLDSKACQSLGFQVKSIQKILEVDVCVQQQLVGLATCVASHCSVSLEEAWLLILPSAYLTEPEPLEPAIYTLSHALMVEYPEFVLGPEQTMDAYSLIHSGRLTTATLNAWVKQGKLCLTDQKPTETEEQPKTQTVLLNVAQQEICQRIMNQQGFHCHYLFGITGSGKTHVYLELIVKQIQQGKQVLLLVPEIGLTPQLLAKVEQVIHKQWVVCLHSQQTPQQRYLGWKMAACNRAKLVIGTRSALFTPMPQLAMIIMDEEHDQSYKQQSHVRYHARQFAYLRAKQMQIPLVFGSATPSMSCFYQHQQKNLEMHQLTRRATGASLPKIMVEAIEGIKLESGLHPQLIEKTLDTLKSGQKVMIYLNRRGFSPCVWCSNCQKKQHCELCDRPYTYHQTSQESRCHRCDVTQAFSEHCRYCKQPSCIPLGQGTERITQTFRAKLDSSVPVIQIDKDTCSSVKKLKSALKTLDNDQACLVIATQLMIKGHHIKGLSMVVFCGADQALYSRDFRAQEWLLQEAFQLVGRSGREGCESSVVYIQTQQPKHPIWQLIQKQDYLSAMTTLIQPRKAMGLPPFSHQAAILMTGKDKTKTQALSIELAEVLTKNVSDGLMVYPVTESFLAKLKGRYRFTVLMQANKRSSLHRSIERIQAVLSSSKFMKTQHFIEFDPIEL